MDPILINAVVFQGSGFWIAHCLEYNFVSFAETRDELPHVLMKCIVAQIKGDLEAGHEPFFGFKPAPAKYWEMFEEAKLQSQPIRKSASVPERNRVEAQLFPIAA